MDDTEILPCSVQSCPRWTAAGCPFAYNCEDFDYEEGVPRRMNSHELKILPEHFQAVWEGDKRAELRKDDRGYEVGDVLVLREWDGHKYTGSGLAVRITHILRNCPEYGLADGYCILSIGSLSDRRR